MFESTWTTEKEHQLAKSLSDMDARQAADARRFNILHAIGPKGHAEIVEDQRTNGGTFEDAVDRYGKHLIEGYYAGLRRSA